MPLDLVVLTRDGEQTRRTLPEDARVTFGRAGHPGTVVVATDQRVSRSAFTLIATREGLVEVSCGQRGGTVEVNRTDGRVAANLEDGEYGQFWPPVRLTLHTTSGAHATVLVSPDRPPVRAGADAAADPSSTVVTGWSTSMIESPATGEDWRVAAALAAILLRRGRRNEPSYTVPRGVLLRVCGQWLGAPKSEGWLASKFRQASEHLAVQFSSNPSQHLAEYVLSSHLLSEPVLRALEAEMLRRRGHGHQPSGG